jgi:rubrerythrin
MPDSSRETLLVCDTCGREAAMVSRVVIDRGYNRADAKPLWNCPDCFRRKEEQRLAAASALPSPDASTQCHS